MITPPPTELVNSDLELLRRFSREKPRSVISKLSLGDIVHKSAGLTYVIDDDQIVRRLGDFPKGAIPCGAIYRKLKGDSSQVVKHFLGRSQIPFSEVFHAGLGECLEKSVLVQLAAQEQEESFLISGALEQEGEVGAGFHAYNLVARQNQLFLVDAQNPVRVEADGKVHVYVAPVEGITGDYGEIQVPKIWKMGRTYCIQ